MGDEWTARARSFGAVAEAYDRHRPGYPDSLYADVLAFAAGGHVLEAGAGTGRATLVLAGLGAAVVAVEPDPAMASVLRRNTAGTGVQVHESAFEDLVVANGTFDLVTAAQSWHWVDPVRGAAVARKALRRGGALAAWWNRPGERVGPAWEAVDAAYAQHAPELSGMDATLREYASAPAPGFGPWQARTYDWAETYDADSYVALICTHSAHVLLPAEQRHRLTDAVRVAINENGGQLEYRYCTLLLAARPA